MSHTSEITIQVLIKIVQVSAVGTNLALLQLMWAMVNGSFLKSRGAVMTALQLRRFQEDNHPESKSGRGRMITNHLPNSGNRSSLSSRAFMAVCDKRTPLS